MKKIWLISIALLGLLIAGPVLGTVGAQENGVYDPLVDDDADGIDDEFEDETERDIEISVSDNEVEIQSEFDNGTVENQMHITMKTEDGIRIVTEYSTEINETETELSLELEFVRLVEFVDLNGDGVLSEGDTERSFDLTEAGYSTPNVTSITSVDGEQGYRLESHSLETEYFFQIIGYIFPSYASIDNVTISPSELKITIVILEFPYDFDNSSLALIIEGGSELEIHTDIDEPDDDNNDYQEDENEIYVESEHASGYFSWVNETLADGILLPVNASTTSSNSGMRVVLVYPHANEIVHDPTLGIVMGISPLTPINPFDSSLVIILGGSAVLALVVTGVILRTRPRIQNGK